LLNFQGFQAELSTEVNFLSYTQYEKETWPNFFQRFSQFKVQAPEVSDDQVIAQAIKGLHVGPQLVAWPQQYRAAPPPKYHGNTDHPHIINVLRSYHHLS
jgi:hypothetical protein